MKHDEAQQSDAGTRELPLKIEAPPWEPTATMISFLAAYGETCSVSHAAKASGIHRATHYGWMRDHPGYVEKFLEARKQGFDLLEEQAIIRARDGVREDVYHDGKVVGFNLRYSDRLAEFLLKGNLPDVYKDRRELTGKDGAPLLNLPMMDRILAADDPDDDTTE